MVCKCNQSKSDFGILNTWLSTFEDYAFLSKHGFMILGLYVYLEMLKEES